MSREKIDKLLVTIFEDISEKEYLSNMANSIFQKYGPDCIFSRLIKIGSIKIDSNITFKAYFGDRQMYNRIDGQVKKRDFLNSSNVKDIEISIKDFIFLKCYDFRYNLGVLRGRKEDNIYSLYMDKSKKYLIDPEISEIARKFTPCNYNATNIVDINISRYCDLMDPCGHYCKILFDNGKNISVYLESYKIVDILVYMGRLEKHEHSRIDSHIFVSSKIDCVFDYFDILARKDVK